MAQTHVLLGIWLQVVHALVLEAKCAMYLMSTLENTDLCHQHHIRQERGHPHSHHIQHSQTFA